MTDADISQLQLLQQNLQQILIQKQQFQKQLTELDSALTELQDTKTAYKIVGNLMISSKKEDLQKDLKEKQELFNLRIKNFQKQEDTLKQKAEELQKQLIKDSKK